jgi:hypothetical protein
MIEPKWLEQTFIVTNRADAPIGSMMDNISLDDESLDIKTSAYRTFIHEHPTQTNYFQTILDRLEVVPSRFDIQRKSIILEGRSDYYVIRYAAEFLGKSNLPLLPGLGAGTLGPLVALHIGWGLDLLFIVDGDKQGTVEKRRYIQEYGLSESSIFTLTDIDPSVTVIEDLIDDEAKAVIASFLKIENSPSKGQIKRFFQESLSTNSLPKLGTHFESLAAKLINELETRLNAKR